MLFYQRTNNLFQTARVQQIFSDPILIFGVQRHSFHRHGTVNFPYAHPLFFVYIIPHFLVLRNGFIRTVLILLSTKMKWSDAFPSASHIFLLLFTGSTAHKMRNGGNVRDGFILSKDVKLSYVRSRFSSRYPEF